MSFLLDNTILQNYSNLRYTETYPTKINMNDNFSLLVFFPFFTTFVVFIYTVFYNLLS